MTRSGSERPHVLYVAWGFPPSRGGGVYRALATANGLVDAGFDVTVLTCEHETFERYTGVDPSLEAQIHPVVDVVRLPFEWPTKERDIRRWPEERARDPQGWIDRRREQDRAAFPEDGYGHWAGPLEEAALRIHATRPVDLTIGTANPNVDLVPALVLHRRFGVPFVYDHRDAWTLHLYEETEAHTEDPRVAQVELELVANSVETWFVNEPISDWHRARYPQHADKIHTVPNGFDREFAWSGVPARRETVAGPIFGYVGTMTSYMPMEELMQAWRQAGSAAELDSARAEFWGYLGFYGTPSESLRLIFDQIHAEDPRVNYRGPVAKTQVADLYAGFDVLLLVIGSGRFLTSGKVYEYMSTGLPIVSVHDLSIDASRVLEGYPNWFPAASLEPADIAAALLAAARAVRDGSATRARTAGTEFAQQYERSRILAPRLAGLRDLVIVGEQA